MLRTLLSWLFVKWAELLVVFLAAVGTLATSDTGIGGELATRNQIAEAFLHTERALLYYFIFGGYLLTSLLATLLFKRYRLHSRLAILGFSPALIFLVHSLVFIMAVSADGLRFLLKPDIYSISWLSLLVFNAFVGTLLYWRTKGRRHRSAA